uniref:protein-tyrosine-phosphatase n=1 Tax=Timema shepardi TaxID=629360 RepID=A0A7R9AXE4_TIMSH|nr:unnamed protein product [Timema shepardi]
MVSGGCPCGDSTYQPSYSVRWLSLWGLYLPAGLWCQGVVLVGTLPTSRAIVSGGCPCGDSTYQPGYGVRGLSLWGLYLPAELWCQVADIVGTLPTSRAIVSGGGFSTFRSGYPEWCESCSELVSGSGPGADVVAVPLMGLRSLRISSTAQQSKRQQHLGSSCSSAATSSTDSSDSDDRCDSSLGLEDDRDFPVKILPHLFLGNQATSADSDALTRHNIQYILNVTADLPNVFEDSGTIKYMQIPIADHWSQNLASFFPKAFKFIGSFSWGTVRGAGMSHQGDGLGESGGGRGGNHSPPQRPHVGYKLESCEIYEARSNEKGILVHCLAGVSRSVTVTVAYLMYKLSLDLNDAFNLVRSRKSNIAPNFHFMEQLFCFQQEMAKSAGKSDDSGKTELSPATKEAKTKDKKTTSSQTSTETTCAPDCKCPAHFLSPLAIGTSPDSGIEFDRWTCTSGE